MKLFLSFFLLSAFFLGACKVTQKGTSSVTEQSSSNTDLSAKIIFTLSKTPCYGTCPVFKMTVFENDSLVYEGERFVDKIGVSSKSLPKGKVKELVSKFRAANFFEFKKEYSAPITDMPTTYISFTDKTKTLKIKDYHGSPEELKQLEQLLVDLVSDEIKVKK
ncbi:DUF6438 domain-containing protein [Arcicella aquatica]|uniref:DUF6438 domain-containing protein n=1 Tax=Arcicella aquatica TaxID=217141 RepID=A0ABU5QLV8_9BACT|nr:DUF6438 domain-containing protein [Arcicella aquatica]MEA5258045.1 DUF6438 domain-containing protein [Arcicella aquatica]